MNCRLYGVCCDSHDSLEMKREDKTKNLVFPHGFVYFTPLCILGEDSSL